MADFSCPHCSHDLRLHKQRIPLLRWPEALRQLLRHGDTGPTHRYRCSQCGACVRYTPWPGSAKAILIGSGGGLAAALLLMALTEIRTTDPPLLSIAGNLLAQLYRVREEGLSRRQVFVPLDEDGERPAAGTTKAAALHGSGDQLTADADCPADRWPTERTTAIAPARAHKKRHPQTGVQRACI